MVKAYLNDVVPRDDVTAGARRIFEQSLALDPECAPAFLGLGMCAVLRKEADEAIARFERAVAIHPGELDLLWTQYRSSVAIHSLFDAAGLAMDEGRVVRAR